MSTKAIWSLAARRNELGRATKGQIYLSKIAIGAVVAFLLWLVSLGSFDVVFIGSLAVFVTSKVCYYVNKSELPTGWDTLPDWVCDCALHFGWLAVLEFLHAEWKGAAFIIVLWLISYPWSAE